MRVIIDESAWSDLDNIALKIAPDNPSAARREMEKIRHVIGLLGEFPALSHSALANRTPEEFRQRYMALAETNSTGQNFTPGFSL